jgi:hypothetical protein
LPSKAKPPSRKTERKPGPPASTRAKAAKAKESAATPAAAPPAEGEPKNETAISASRGLVDFLRTHRLSFALTSYQTGQLMLIGVLPDGRLSVFQRNFVRACPGFLRGLSFWRHFALVATSLPRDSSFQGLELEDNLKARDGEARCGAFIVDTRNGDLLHWIRFEGTVRELFDTAFLPGVRAPMCVGLAAPEMRTLITLEGEGVSSTPVPAKEGTA